MRRSLVVTAVAVGLSLAAPAAARLPKTGTLVPGHSLGGIRLGESPRGVRSALGTFYGVCRSCSRRTWYFTYRPFGKRGLAVEFQRGHVSGVYTLWRPTGWRAPHGLAFGSSQLAVDKITHAKRMVICGNYDAVIRDTVHARTVYYVFGSRLWGFGLFHRGDSPCR